MPQRMAMPRFLVCILATVRKWSSARNPIITDCKKFASSSASVVLGDVSSSISSSSIASNNTTDSTTAKKGPGSLRLTDEVKNARAAIKAQEQIDKAAIKANKIKK